MYLAESGSHKTETIINHQQQKSSPVKFRAFLLLHTHAHTHIRAIQQLTVPADICKMHSQNHPICVNYASATSLYETTAHDCVKQLFLYSQFNKKVKKNEKFLSCFHKVDAKCPLLNAIL